MILEINCACIVSKRREWEKFNSRIVNFADN